MGRLFCLMGRSATGKDTIYNRLLEMEDLQLKKVIPYTTRPIRTGEVDGETYFFRTNEEADALEAAGKVIELRSYDTVHGIWKYFTADDGQIRLDEQDYLMIGTVEAYVKVRDYFGEDKVCPIFVWVDSGELLARALQRERMQEEPKYAEMCRRFLADEQDFSQEKIQEARITRLFENRELEETLEEIRGYILDCR